MFEFLPIFILERFHVSFFFSFQHIANGLYLHKALGYLALLHRRVWIFSGIPCIEILVCLSRSYRQ